MDSGDFGRPRRRGGGGLGQRAALPAVPTGLQLESGGGQRGSRRRGRGAAGGAARRAWAVVSVLPVRGAFHHAGAPAVPVLAVAADVVQGAARRGATDVRDPVVLEMTRGA